MMRNLFLSVLFLALSSMAYADKDFSGNLVSEGGLDNQQIDRIVDIKRADNDLYRVRVIILKDQLDNGFVHIEIKDKETDRIALYNTGVTAQAIKSMPAMLQDINDPYSREYSVKVQKYDFKKRSMKTVEIGVYLDLQESLGFNYSGTK